MAAHLSALLILVALTGIHSITTVSKVSVKRGDSISVPCLYESKYKAHVKYLCEGWDWIYCTYAVKTNEPSGSGRFSISDDKQKRVFTVTINNPSANMPYFWCAVEINQKPDIRIFFQLSVNQDHPQLSVDHQEVTGFIGEDVTINCHYTVGGESRWCRLGGSCVKEPSGSIEGTKVTINVKDTQVFSVTLSGLRRWSSGWYYCAKGDLQMPVHVTVEDRPGTTTLTATAKLSAFLTTRQPTSCTSVSAHEEQTTAQTRPDSTPYHLLAPIITLVLIIVLTVTASIIWFTVRSHEQKSVEPPPAEDELVYSAVTHVRQTFNKDQSQDEVVTYSTLPVH